MALSALDDLALTEVKELLADEMQGIEITARLRGPDAVSTEQRGNIALLIGWITQKWGNPAMVENAMENFPQHEADAMGTYQDATEMVQFARARLEGLGITL